MAHMAHGSHGAHGSWRTWRTWLVAHLADAYEERLKPLTHVEIFTGLLLRHEQNEDFRRTGAAPGAVSSGPAGAGGAAGGGVGAGAGFGVRRAPPTYMGGRRAFPDEEEDVRRSSTPHGHSNDGSS